MLKPYFTFYPNEVIEIEGFYIMDVKNKNERISVALDKDYTTLCETSKGLEVAVDMKYSLEIDLENIIDDYQITAI